MGFGILNRRSLYLAFERRDRYVINLLLGVTMTCGSTPEFYFLLGSVNTAVDLRRVVMRRILIRVRSERELAVGTYRRRVGRGRGVRDFYFLTFSTVEGIFVVYVRYIYTRINTGNLIMVSGGSFRKVSKVLVIVFVVFVYTGERGTTCH